MDPKRPESHRLIFGCAGVKPTSQRTRPKNQASCQCSCRNTGARLGRSESHSPQPPLVGCVPSGTLPRFLQLKSSLESAFEFIRVEKTAYLLLQEHLVPLRRDPKRPESHQPFFSCAGVKPTPQQDAQNHASGSVFLQEHWCATWTLPQIARSAAPLGGYVPSGTLPRTALPLTPSRCIPIVEGRVNSPPTTMTVVFLQEHSTGFAHNSCFCT